VLKRRLILRSIAVVVISCGILAAQESSNPIVALGRRANEPPTFYCNLNALSPKERAKQEKIAKKIWAAQTAIKELEDGYAFQLQREKVSLVELAEWIIGEDKCCSFFHFEVEVERNRGPLWLKIRGDQGIKKFIQATFPAAAYQ
jgi:hypothetical protein